MLRKVFAFLLLISHMNTSMFLPQVPEQDAYDSAGQPVNDINSVVEFVNEVVLGRHHQPVDEDDDNGQNFHMIKMVDHVYQPFLVKIDEDIHAGEESALHFPYYNERRLHAGYTRVLFPPPKPRSIC